MAETIALACDHAGLGLKAYIAALLDARGLAVLDLGTHNGDSVDYPDYGYKLARAVADGMALALAFPLPPTAIRWRVQLCANRG